MAVIDVQNLSLSFGEKVLFSGVSFDIKEKKRSDLSAATAQVKPRCSKS